jgi:hypothetical protein
MEHARQKFAGDLYSRIMSRKPESGNTWVSAPALSERARACGAASLCILDANLLSERLVLPFADQSSQLPPWGKTV